MVTLTSFIHFTLNFLRVSYLNNKLSLANSILSSKSLKKSSIFSWMNNAKQIEGHTLKVFHEKKPLIYKHLHFSTYGKFQAQKEEEIKAIHNIILGSNISDLT